MEPQLRFIRCEDREMDYGLAHVRVIYPEDTDVQTVQPALTERYGSNIQEIRPKYDLQDGIIEYSAGKNRDTLTINGETVVRDYPGIGLRAFRGRAICPGRPRTTSWYFLRAGV